MLLPYFIKVVFQLKSGVWYIWWVINHLVYICNNMSFIYMCMADRTAPSWGQSLQILSMMATHGESTAKNIFKTHLITQGICACIIVRNLYIIMNNIFSSWCKGRRSIETTFTSTVQRKDSWSNNWSLARGRNNVSFSFCLVAYCRETKGAHQTLVYNK